MPVGASVRRHKPFCSAVALVIAMALTGLERDEKKVLEKIADCGRETETGIAVYPDPRK